MWTDGKARTTFPRVPPWLVVLGLVACIAAQGPVAPDGQEIELEGVIRPSRTVDVSAGVLTGLLAEIHVERGDFVEEGELVAVLDSRMERATLELAQARVELTASLDAARSSRDYFQNALERARDLFDEEILSIDGLEQAEEEALLAENRYQAEQESQMLAELELQRAEVALEMRELRSPVTGVVTERLVDPGEFVGQEPLLSIARLDPLFVEVVAPASHYGSIRVGMTGTVLPGEPVGGNYRATVTVVDRVLDAASNTFGIRLELPNPGYNVPAGLRGRVRFVLDS